METAADITSAERLLFPGVGAYEQAMGVLTAKGYIDPLKDYIQVFHSHPLSSLQYACMPSCGTESEALHAFQRTCKNTCSVNSPSIGCTCRGT